jgi:enoyl-CoA hydratase
VSQLVSLQLGRISVIQLNDPPLNLITKSMTVQLENAIEKVRDSHETRVLIITGMGNKAFCAGSDIKEFISIRKTVVKDKLLLENWVYRSIERLPIPTIAAIEGAALGGGLELALCCDLRIAGSSARFGTPEVKLGVFPGSGGTHRLPNIVGLAKAKEMIFLGETMSSTEALSVGLLNVVVPDGEAVESALRMATQIANRAPLAVSLAKQLINQIYDDKLDVGMANSLRSSAEIFQSNDLLEGVEAFFQKKLPEFRGN